MLHFQVCLYWKRSLHWPLLSKSSQKEKVLPCSWKCTFPEIKSLILQNYIHITKSRGNQLQLKMQGTAKCLVIKNENTKINTCLQVHMFWYETQLSCFLGLQYITYIHILSDLLSEHLKSSLIGLMIWYIFLVLNSHNVAFFLSSRVSLSSLIVLIGVILTNYNLINVKLWRCCCSTEWRPE